MRDSKNVKVRLCYRNKALQVCLVRNSIPRLTVQLRAYVALSEMLAKAWKIGSENLFSNHSTEIGSTTMSNMNLNQADRSA